MFQYAAFQVIIKMFCAAVSNITTPIISILSFAVYVATIL